MNEVEGRINQGIAEARDRVKTQVKLAEVLGLKPLRVWQFLHGHAAVSIEMALQLEDELGVPRWKTRPDVWKERQ